MQGAMHAMMGARMPGPGMMGLPGAMTGGPRGPVPPPKPPPPKSPPREEEYMKLMMKNAMKNMQGTGGMSREEEMLMRAFELSRGRASPARDRRRYRYA